MRRETSRHTSVASVISVVRAMPWPCCSHEPTGSRTTLTCGASSRTSVHVRSASMRGGLGDTVVLQGRLVQLNPKAGRLRHHGVAMLDLQGLDDEIVLAQEVADNVAGERAAAC